MRFLLILTTLFSLSSFANNSTCTNFSGTYVEVASSEVLQISQWGCVTLTATYRTRACTTYVDQLVFDGVKYPVEFDGWQSHVINGNMISGEVALKNPGQTFYYKTRMYLDENLDLIMESSSLDASGNVTSSKQRKYIFTMKDGAPGIPSCGGI